MKNNNRITEKTPSQRINDAATRNDIVEEKIIFVFASLFYTIRFVNSQIPSINKNNDPTTNRSLFK